MLSYLSEALGGADSVQDKRLAVLQLHVHELTRQADARKAELAAAQAQLKELAHSQQMTQAQERKLFGRVESLQAELKQVREQKSKAEERGAELQAQLEKVVDAAKAEDAKPGEKLLLAATTEQLEATHTLLQQALQRAVEAEEKLELVRKEQERCEMEREVAVRNETAMQRRLSAYINKLARAEELSLAPPERGNDLEEQHHILQLSFRTVTAELTRKTVAAEALARECDQLRSQLDSRLSELQLQGRKARERQAERQKQSDAAVESLRSQLEKHVASLARIRQLGATHEKASHTAATRAFGEARAVAAVRQGALLACEQRLGSERRRYEERLKLMQATHEATVRSLKERAVITYREREEQSAKAIERLEAELASALKKARTAETEVREAQADAVRLRAELTSISLSGRMPKHEHQAKCGDDATNEAEGADGTGEAEADGGHVVADESIGMAQLRAQLEESLRQAASAQEEREAARLEANAVAEELQRARATQRQLERELEEAQRAAGEVERAREELELATQQAEARAQGKAQEEVAAAHAELLARLQQLGAERQTEQQKVAGELAALQRELSAEREASALLRQREASLQEELVREQTARKEATARVGELRQKVPDGELHRWLHEARDAAAAARGEVVALKLQLNQQKDSQQLAASRERDLQRKLQKSEHEVAQAWQQVEALRAQCSQLQAEAGEQRARMQAAMTERERQLNEKAAAFRQESLQLRQAMQQQQAAAARQISEVQSAMHTLKHQQAEALLAASVPSVRPTLNTNTDGGLMDSAVPVMNGDGVQMVPLSQVEALRAQLALAQKRLSMGSEFRQLSESFKAKAERLQQQLLEERAQAQAQSQLWKEQLHLLRVRARADKEKLVTLQQQIANTRKRNEHAVSPIAFSSLNSTPIFRACTQNGTPHGRGTFASARCEQTPSTRGNGPSSGHSVMGLLDEVDSRVNRAFDRIEGASKEFVERLSRPLSSQLDKHLSSSFAQVPTDYTEDD